MFMQSSFETRKKGRKREGRTLESKESGVKSSTFLRTVETKDSVVYLKKGE